MTLTSSSSQPTLPPVEPAVRRPRRFPRVAFLLGVTLLLGVVNLSHWRYFIIFRDSKERELLSRLRTAAVALAADITREQPVILEWTASLSEDDQERVLAEDYIGTPGAQRLADRVAAHRSIFRLAQSTIVTTGGKVVTDSTGRVPSGDDWRFWLLDQDEVNTALGGTPATTILYRIDRAPYQRCYAPIMQDRHVVGLAVVALSPDYTDQVTMLASQAMRQSMLASALLLILAFSLWSLFRQVIRLEERAMQSARVEAMGTMAGALAHELRNPLSIIRVLGEEVLSTEPADAPAARNVRDILTETNRLKDLTTRFLSLARPASGAAREPQDIALETRRTIDFVRKGASARTTILTEIPDGPIMARVDLQGWRQVLLNLLLNANEACKSKGTITVSMAAKRDRVEVRVVDNGPGIEPRNREKIFDPFFSTKPTGTGLGLPICRTIVENADGKLELQSTVGKGTTVIISLPAA